MTSVDLVVRNGWVVNPSGRLHGGVAVEGERIVQVGPDQSLPSAHRVIDAQSNFILPGLIDPHVHMGSEEDQSLQEGLEANLPVETSGMLHGGVTTFGHFVGVRGEPLASQIRQTASGVNRWSSVDCFLHAYVMGADSLAAQGEAWDLGVTSFKHFYNSYRRRPLEDDGLATLFAPVESDVLLHSMRFIASKGRPGLAMVHAEDIDIISVFEELVSASGRADLGAWSDSRPNIAEWTRVRQAIDLARLTACPLYVVHLTTAESCQLVRDAVKDGLSVQAEVGPQWLTHHGGMEEQVGCWGKVNPPLRSSEDCEELWRGIHHGGITCVGTDHGTGGRTRQTKEHGGGKHSNIWRARPGIRGGSEQMLAVLMTFGVHAGRISMEDLVRITSTDTARIFGLYPRKGALVPGADADIVVVDPHERSIVDSSFYRGLCEVSIYTGMELQGLARITVTRGRVGMLDGDIIPEPGWGRFLPRGAAAEKQR